MFPNVDTEKWNSTYKQNREKSKTFHRRKIEVGRGLFSQILALSKFDFFFLSLKKEVKMGEK